MSVRGADLLAEVLSRAGAEYVFGGSGDSVLPVFDALYDHPEIRFILTRHEQAAAHMADGYARASGRPGFFLVHVGPGACNTVIGMAAAFKDDVPVVGMSGQQEQDKLGRDVFHEMDQMALFRPVSKWARRAERPAEVARVLTEGINRAMSGRKGPVFLELPKNVMRDAVEEDEVMAPLELTDERERRPYPDPAQVERALEAMRSWRRPVILAGAGVIWADACGDLRDLAAMLGWPVVTGSSGRGAIPEDHPLSAGFAGTFGMITAGRVLREADGILALGCKFSDNVTANWKLVGPAAHIVHCDVDPEAIGRHVPAEVPVVADAGHFIRALAAALRERDGLVPRSDGELEALPRIAELRRLRAEERRRFYDPADEGKPMMQPQYVIRELEKLLRPDAIIATGAGANRIYADRIPIRTPRSYLKSINFGALGFAFPAALGAKLAQPGRQVVDILGDGDFIMTLQELETAVRCRIGVVNVVVNNSSYASTKNFQRRFFGGRYYGNDFGNPDYARLAETFGARGVRVERLDDLAGALDACFEAAESGLPSVMDVICDPEANPYDITGLTEQVKALIGVR
jgi:acetolactate synthase-1/2/3 large subunit